MVALESRAQAVCLGVLCARRKLRIREVVIYLTKVNFLVNGGAGIGILEFGLQALVIFPLHSPASTKHHLIHMWRINSALLGFL